MNKNDNYSQLSLKEIMERHNIKALKSLGQHFLFDQNLTRRIAKSSGDLSGITVIEIGAGPGGLTRSLLETNASCVVAIERDEKCISALKELQNYSKNRLKIIEGDALNIDLIDQTVSGPHGGINKIIYAGYATDPLNYEHIDDLIEKSVNLGQVVGIHSKLIKISDRLVDILSSDKVAESSYMTVSVDGGDNKSYNLAHNLSEKVKVYERVIANIKKLTDLFASKKKKFKE